MPVRRNSYWLGLRTLAQQPAFLGERDGVTAAFKQRDAQFLFQLFELTGERRLGNTQQLRGPRDIAFLGNRQKISQDAQFHPRGSFGVDGLLLPLCPPSVNSLC